LSPFATPFKTIHRFFSPKDSITYNAQFLYICYFSFYDLRSVPTNTKIQGKKVNQSEGNKMTVEIHGFYEPQFKKIKETFPGFIRMFRRGDVKLRKRQRLRSRIRLLRSNMLRYARASEAARMEKCLLSLNILIDTFCHVSSTSTGARIALRSKRLARAFRFDSFSTLS
jgi:hypothetical protein